MNGLTLKKDKLTFKITRINNSYVEIERKIFLSSETEQQKI